MSTEPNLWNQQEVNNNQRQAMLPFRRRPYLIIGAISAALSVGVPASASMLGTGLLFLIFIFSIFCVSFFVYSICSFIHLLFSIFFLDPIGRFISTSERRTNLQIFCLLAFHFIVILCGCITFTAPELLINKDLPEIVPDFITTSYSKYYLYLWAWLPFVLFIIYGLINFILLGITKMIDCPPDRKNVRHICPNEDCGFVGDAFAYRCPHCGEALTELHPSRYGFFHIRCPHCGNKVSCSSWTGRNEYSQTCPICQSSMTIKEFGEIPETVYVVEGAFQSGKTSFLMQTLAQWSVRFPDQVSFSMDKQKNDVLLSVQKLKEKEFSLPTERLLNPGAYVMHYKESDRDSLAYFYDAGGITCDNLDAGASEPYYNLANGIFLIIDPWEESGIVKAYGNNSKQPFSNSQFGTLDASSVIGRLCSKLEHLYPESLSEGFDIPLCVVVTKCDINGLSNAIGVNERFTQSSNKLNAHSKQVEDFLVKHGMYNFVNVVKTRFKKNAFFAVSVLENTESVLNPLLWMTCNVK